MASGVILLLFIISSIVSLQHVCGGRQLVAESPIASELSGGLGPYLRRSSKYSLFLELVEKLDVFNTDLQVGWYKGPTNQTVLLVDNTHLRGGFAKLANLYNISDPDTFIDRLIEGKAFGLGQGDNSHTNEAYIPLLAFAGSHILAVPYDFYANQTILQAPYQSPVKLQTGISGFGSSFGNMQAYAAANTSGPTTIFLRQKDGLLNAKDGLAVPRSFLTATGRNEDLEEVDEGTGPATLYVYEMDGIFLFG